MDEFEKVYKKLNPEQKLAVDTVDGPMLVIAGPGTGKTQLLSARVAQILRTTDTLPQNILCLTFTENGATNMRERLSSFIGQAAYDVNIGTYHAFGGDIIRRYNQYFDEDLRDPADTLKKHQIVEAIVSSLSYQDPLKQTRHHIKDLLATISEMKRGLLTAEDLRTIAHENNVFIEAINPRLADIFASFTSMRGKYQTIRTYFANVFEELKELEPAKPVSATYGSLANCARLSLELALLEADAANTTKPLTAWKDSWLSKDPNNNFVIGAALENQRLVSLASVLEAYEAALRAEGLYDFDDMILRAIDAMKNHDDLRFTLQEQYQYILLDEYQDTNRAQAELVYLLTNNPASEGRPNVMAVGDDDQAIYAFQGAQYSNMLEFFKNYTGTRLVSLKENYRSSSDILTLGATIAGQINERLMHELSGTTKELVAANTTLPVAHIERRDFKSSQAEYDWVAHTIATLLEEGVNPKEIAVLTPKHKPLETFVPYARDLGIPIKYEKRENILEAPIVRELLTACRLVLALASDEQQADSLWPEVLSSPWYTIPVTTIWQLSWSVSDARRSGQSTSWTRQMIESSDDSLRAIALLFAGLSQLAATSSSEHMLDYLVGETGFDTKGSDGVVYSPLKEYFVAKGDTQLLDAVAQLTVLRTALRDRQRTSEEALSLRDLLELVDAYQAAGEPLLNTNPYTESANSVQLMTAYKAKGLEFEHVFLLGCTNDQWGSDSRENNNKLTLPANLAPTRHSGGSEDERLRLLFVALTRAKTHLYLTAPTATFSGKQTVRLKSFDERENEHHEIIAHALPETAATVANDDHDSPSLQTLQLDWRAPHLDLSNAPLKDLLDPRLARYQLSPTHLNTFCDLIYGGPQAFFLKTILMFPSAPSVDGQYGNAIHETLEWVQHRTTANSTPPTEAQVVQQFEKQLRAKKLASEETELLLERGKHALTQFLQSRLHIFTADDRAETNFRYEGVFVGEAHLAGKIDRLEIDQRARTITVVDYKTGKPHGKWSSDARLHKYRQQLICYKLLVEGSHSFDGYTVSGGRLEFIEPDDQGQLHQLELHYDHDEVEMTRQLLIAVWQHIHEFDFPDITSYTPDIKGIRAFEDFLLR